MTCAPTDRLLQTIRVQVPGVTDELVSLQLFNIMDEFFRRTSAWRHEDAVQLDPGVVEYSYGVPSGSVLVRMLGVSHNNVPVPVATGGGSVLAGVGTLDPALVFPDGDAAFTPDASDLTPSDIFSWAVYRPDMISITVPSGELTHYPAILLMALSLSRSCLECESCEEWNVPEWMWDMYFQDWLDGALGRLYGMPAKPWNSQTHAVYHAKRFRNHMAYRKQESPRGFVYGSPGPVMFPRGWTR